MGKLVSGFVVLMLVCLGASNAMALELKSEVFREGDFIPKKFTGEGPDVSPPLFWDQAPEGTKSFALIVDDPDAPVGTWVHWALYNIPDAETKLPEGVLIGPEWEKGILQGRNDFGNFGYGGPLPPKGKPHRYFFRLYALDIMLNVPPGISKRELMKAMETHILGTSELMGMYQR